jgi:hypothetical protein
LICGCCTPASSSSGESRLFIQTRHNDTLALALRRRPRFILGLIQRSLSLTSQMSD